MRLSAAVLIGVVGCADGDRLLLFSAASMEDAVTAIAPEAEVNAAASSLLARQAAAGAPVAVFVSADQDWVDWLDERRPLLDQRILATNRLVEIEPRGIGGATERVAIADPTHVPAGRYARAALEALGEYDADRIVAAGDVRGVLALVERGEVARGVVYATDAALSDRVRVRRTLRSPTPIRYVAALLAPEGAEVFDALTGDAGRNVFARFGFLSP